ncbi:MAG: DUF268 domain-containing protein [Nitrososphaerota archaeon]
MRVPRAIYPLARFVYRKLLRPKDSGVRIPNILGDRDIEYSFAIEHIPKGQGYALDFGSGSSMMPLILARMGYETVALDRMEQQFMYRHPRVSFIQGDILEDQFDWTAHFELISNISTIEHVGLAGRYGVEHADPDGDLKAMKILHKWLKPGGIMILTVPVGTDAVFPPMARVYGKERLPALIEGFQLVYEEFWAKLDEKNQWEQVSKETALSMEADIYSPKPEGNYYAIGCFLLKK